MLLTTYLSAVVVGVHAFAEDVGRVLDAVARFVAGGWGAPGAAPLLAQLLGWIVVPAIPICALVFLFTYVSRRFETEADLFAAESLGEPSVARRHRPIGAERQRAASRDPGRDR